MTSIPDLSDLISLSLLPPWTWRDAAERLRGGAPPAAVLTELLDRRASGQSERATLDRRALSALRRANEGGISALPWSDPSYPAAYWMSTSTFVTSHRAPGIAGRICGLQILPPTQSVGLAEAR